MKAVPHFEVAHNDHHGQHTVVQRHCSNKSYVLVVYEEFAVELWQKTRRPKQWKYDVEKNAKIPLEDRSKRFAFNPNPRPGNGYG